MIAKNCFFINTNFKAANLTGLNIGIFPDLRGHTAGITCLSYSPDNTKIITGSRDCTTIIWDS